MKYIYTAILVPEENGSGFFARVPDLPGCITTGKNLSDTIDMITNAASIWLVTTEDEHPEDINTPTPQCDIECPDNAVLTLIQIDTLAYRAEIGDTTVIKKVEHYFYPAIFIYEPDQEIAVEFPDLNCATSGINDDDALLSARELLGIVINGLMEDGEEIPAPTPLDKIVVQQNERTVLIDVCISSIHQAHSSGSSTTV